MDEHTYSLLCRILVFLETYETHGKMRIAAEKEASDLRNEVRSLLASTDADSPELG